MVVVGDLVVAEEALEEGEEVAADLTVGGAAGAAAGEEAGADLAREVESPRVVHVVVAAAAVAAVA